MLKMRDGMLLVLVVFAFLGCTETLGDVLRDGGDNPKGDMSVDTGSDADTDSDVDGDTDADADTDTDADADTDTDSDGDYASCTACHGEPPMSGAHASHALLSCASCHPEVSTGTESTHDDGTVQVSESSWDSATLSCSGSCHPVQLGWY